MIMIEKNTLYLYLYNIEESEHKNSHLLTDHETKKHNRLSNKQQADYLKQRHLIRQSLESADLPTDSLNYTNHGKPYLPPPYQVSISHSKQWLVVAIMNASILGVDLQINPPKHPNNLIKRFHLPSMSPKALLLHWTLAEATSKAYGIGLLHCLYDPQEIITKHTGYYFSLDNPHLSAVSDQPILNQKILYPKNHSRLW